MDLISRQAAICAVCRNCLRTDLEVLDGCLGKDCSIKPVLESLPSVEPKIDDENELKFYYVESIDDYWIGQRLDNFYYADWHDGLGFVWSHSRYLPWGEHIVDENTLWKEHTYPSEPIEIPFTEWIVGFMKKYSAEPKTGKWIRDGYDFHHGNDWIHCSVCGKRGINVPADLTNFCPNCGSKMVGEDGEA